MSTLHNYLTRIETTVHRRSDINAHDFVTVARSRIIGYATGRLIFYDGSFLDVNEVVAFLDYRIKKLSYSYHYQRGEQVVFRYDNAPHFPGLSDFLHHKHIGDRVEGCAPPDWVEVLKEIDSILYPASK